MSSSRQRSGIIQFQNRLRSSNELIAKILDGLPGPIVEALFKSDAVAETSFEFVKPDDRSVFAIVYPRLANAVIRLVQLQSVCEHTYKCRRMARRYPWAKTPISQSDHLYFVWFNFTNHCYLFRERTKLFANDYNSLRSIFGQDKKNVKQYLDEIDGLLAEHIKHRGQHVHEYHNDHISYSNLGLVELVEKLGLSQKIQISSEREFKLSKLHMGIVIERALDFMISFFDKVAEEVVIEIRSIGEVLNHKFFSISS